VEKPSYLQFEDFSHTSLGLETYEDGLQHPRELRRILTGDLSFEMSVSFRARAEEAFQALAYPQQQQKRGVEIFDSMGRSVYSSFGLQQMQHSSSWVSLLEGDEIPQTPEEQGYSSLLHLMAQQQHSSLSLQPRKPGRPPTAQGAFDPETGSVRYICRLHCGASLASAKGRRKHEKKHCPNFGKYAQPRLRGRGRGSGIQMGHTTMGERRTYECRICGKVLRTYEGRRLHEKLQHVAKMRKEEDNAILLQEDPKDSKQLLLEHLKAAGLDPSILEAAHMNGDENEDNIADVIGEANNESFDNEDDEDEEEEEEEEVPASSSSGIEEIPIKDPIENQNNN